MNIDMNLLNEFYFEENCIDSVDLNHFALTIQEVKDVFQYKKDIKSLCLGGYLAVVALSKKIRRKPHDIDISINPEDAIPLLKKLEKDWDWAFTTGRSGNAIFLLKSFLNGEHRKFGSAKLHQGSYKRDEADIFAIKNGQSFLHESKFAGNTYYNLVEGYQPEWVYHNPNEQRLYGLPFFEEVYNMFKIGFFTKRRLPEFAACLIFYDENFKEKEIINCDFSCDAGTNLAYWSSPLLQKEKFEKTFYKLIVFKIDYHYSLIGKQTGVMMDVWINPCVNRETVDFLGQEIEVSTDAAWFAKQEWKREKDVTDLVYYDSVFSRYKIKREDFLLEKARMQIEI